VAIVNIEEDLSPTREHGRDRGRAVILLRDRMELLYSLLFCLLIDTTYRVCIFQLGPESIL
jgi:hypothetical protein